MNKNFIFLLLPLLALTTQVFTQESTRRRKREHDAEEQRQDKQEQQLRREQQKQERDQRADRRDEQKCAREDAQILETAQAEAHNSSTIIRMLELCFTGDFVGAEELCADIPDINQPINYTPGNTILHLSCYLYLMYETDIRLDQVFTFLLEHGADPAQLNYDGQTTLHVICQYDFDEQTEMILDLVLQRLHQKELIDTIDIHGRHAFHYACCDSNTATSYFIRNNIEKAWLTHHDVQGMTPMDLAAGSNKVQLDQLFN